MEAEIKQERRKKHIAEERADAQAAADAEEIAASTPSLEDRYAQKEVAMRLAVDRVAQEQKKATREAEGIAREADAARGLGDSAELREEEKVSAHESEVEAAISRQVAAARARMESLEAKAGVSTVPQAKPVTANKTSFSMKELEQGDKDGEATQTALETKVKQMMNKVKGTTKDIKKDLKAHGHKLPLDSRTQQILKLKAKIAGMKAAQTAAHEVNKKAATNMSRVKADASKFLNGSKAGDKVLSTKLQRLENMLKAQGSKLIAARHKSLSKRIDALKSEVASLLAGKEVNKEQKADSKMSKKLESMSAAVRRYMSYAKGTRKGLFDDMSKLNAEQKKEHLLDKKEALQSELAALKRKAALMKAGTAAAKSAVKREAALDLLAKKEKLAAMLSAEKRDLRRKGERRINNMKQKRLQEGDKAGLLEESAEAKYDRESLRFQKMHVQFEVLQATDKRNSQIFTRATNSLLKEKKREDTLLLAAKAKRAKLKDDLSVFAEAADGALWQAETNAKKKEAAEEAAYAAKEALERALRDLALIKEGTADAMAARARCEKLIGSMKAKLAKLRLEEQGARKSEVEAKALRAALASP